MTRAKFDIGAQESQPEREYLVVTRKDLHEARQHEEHLRIINR